MPIIIFEKKNPPLSANKEEVLTYVEQKSAPSYYAWGGSDGVSTDDEDSDNEYASYYETFSEYSRTGHDEDGDPLLPSTILNCEQAIEFVDELKTWKQYVVSDGRGTDGTLWKDMVTGKFHASNCSDEITTLRNAFTSIKHFASVWEKHVQFCKENFETNTVESETKTTESETKTGRDNSESKFSNGDEENEENLMVGFFDLLTGLNYYQDQDIQQKWNSEVYRVNTDELICVQNIIESV
jgi:hypothetical protein